MWALHNSKKACVIRPDDKEAAHLPQSQGHRAAAHSSNQTPRSSRGQHPREGVKGSSEQKMFRDLSTCAPSRHLPGVPRGRAVDKQLEAHLASLAPEDDPQGGPASVAAETGGPSHTPRVTSTRWSATRQRRGCPRRSTAHPVRHTLGPGPVPSCLRF